MTSEEFKADIRAIRWWESAQGENSSARWLLAQPCTKLYVSWVYTGSEGLVIVRVVTSWWPSSTRG